MNIINKQQFTVVASPFRANLSMNENLLRLEEVTSRLTNDYWLDNIKTVIGSYREEGQKQNKCEVSLMIPSLTWSEVTTLKHIFCTEYEQDCILVINTENNRCALFGNDWSEELGWWTEVTRTQAHEAGNYTYDTNGRYWLAK